MNIAKEIDTWVETPATPLNIKFSEAEIQLTQKLRHLAGKRLTCLAQWKSETVIAKFFYGARAQQQVEKESAVLKELIKKGIRTPKFLAMYEKAGCSVLLIEYIADAISLAKWLKDEPEQSAFEKTMSKTTTLMLECHRAGFEIKDPHLDNLLIRKDDVFIIDAGDITQFSEPLNNERSLQNMALLYAQLPVTQDVITFQVLKNILLEKSDLEAPNEKEWQQRLIRQRRWRQKKFIDKKVFRDCTAYHCEQSSSRFLVAKRDFFTDEVAQALTNPDMLIEKGTLLKNGNTATVAKVEIGDKTYVLKRYNIKKPIHSFIRGFMWSRAAVSWRNGLLLEMLGIPTAKSYVMIEGRWGALRRRSYLLSEFISAPTAWDIFEDKQFNEQNRSDWAKKISELFMLLKRNQVSHGDLKAQNILCHTKTAALIDLDGLQSTLVYKKFLQRYKKDIQRFQISWPSKWRENPYFAEYVLALLNSEAH
ncbi:MAG: serine/threonine protein phosphatase [Cycloclasticus sp. symbiont of Poecilosclerida sp. N]|nr:MAG: serine/threonine protein phosphatase [Cycloclasticus sp. symbiont of Poecilosclerida sp. N]